MINKTFIPFLVVIILLMGQAAYAEAVRPLLYPPLTCAEWWHSDDSKTVRDGYYGLINTLDTLDHYSPEIAQQNRRQFAYASVPPCFKKMQKRIEGWSVRRIALWEHFYLHPRPTVINRVLERSGEELWALWQDLWALTKVRCQPINEDCVH